MLQNLFATFKVTQEHWNHYPTDLILRYMQLLWHTHMHAHTFTHTLTGFYSFLKWHFKLASVSNALFCRASEKNRLDCSFEQPWGIWDCCCCYWCGISADFCPRLACLSASETLYILSCWPPAGRGINNKNTSHGRTDVDTASLHLAISTDSSCPRTLLLCHSNASKETSTNTPSHTHTHTHIYAYQYPNHTHSNTSYSTHSSLVCWSLSFLSSWSMWVREECSEVQTNSINVYTERRASQYHIQLSSAIITYWRSSIPLRILELSNLFSECSLVSTPFIANCNLQLSHRTRSLRVCYHVCVCVTVLFCPYSHSVFI